jgi:uncharacterized membrane-anchored protein
MVRKLGEIKLPLTALSEAFVILSQYIFILDMGEVVTCSVCLAMSLCLVLGPRREVGLNHTDSCNDCLWKDVRHSRRLSTCLFSWDVLQAKCFHI